MASQVPAPRTLAAAVLLALTVTASAQHAQRHSASLLLYPEFDNRQANLTLVTVSNTNCDFTAVGGSLLAGTIDVEFNYMGRYDPKGNPIPCQKLDRTVRLTPCDTFTFITSAHNPEHEQGFVYAFAKSAATGEALDFDWLIGQAVKVNGIQALGYSTNAVAFRGEASPGQPTDQDDDGIRDLDGTEYEGLGERLFVPRFVASGIRAGYDSELVLIGLSGGAQFTTVVDFLVYNDNEEAFSATHTFQCWERVKLTSISGAFGNAFLQGTNHDPDEILGADLQESGWFEFWGQVAFSSAAQIDHPAVYGVLIERLLAGAAVADLPWESEKPTLLGDLFPQTLLGDGY